MLRHLFTLSDNARTGYPWHELIGPANLPNTILAIIGFVGIIAALLTLGAIREQARAQMDADRAWVLVSVVGQPQEPLAASIVRTGNIPGIVWKIKIAGNTPAQITRARYRCRTVPMVDGKPDLEKTPTYLANEIVIAQATVLAPNDSYLVSIGHEPTPERMSVVDEMTATLSGTRAFCAYGTIEYKDAFGRSGETQFCAIYRPQLGGIIKSPDGTVLNPPGFYIAGPDGYNYNT